MMRKIELQPKYISSFEEILMGIDLDNKTVLDIGCGDAMLALYLAKHKNVKKVLCIDNYQGRGNDPSSYYDALNLSKKFEKIDLIVRDINKFRPRRQFDCISAINTLHHLFFTEESFFADAAAYKYFTDLFSGLRKMLKPGGKLVINEISPLNLFLGRLFLKRVHWKSKHFPSEWKRCLEDAGFNKVVVRYCTPAQLRKIPFSRIVFNNPVMNVVLLSTYTIVATNQEEVINELEK